MIASLLRCVLRRFYRISTFERALTEAFASYAAAVGRPSQGCRDLTLARHEAQYGGERR